MFKLKKNFAAGAALAWLSVTAVCWAQVIQTAFLKPQDAVDAVVKACQKNNTADLLKIFGPDSKDIVESGNRTEDKAGRQKFAALATEKLNLITDPMDPNKVIISIGNQDWPFPIPLVRQDGQWRFSSLDGRQEILARRIGSNEMNAIEICRGYVEAQFEYAQTHRVNGVPVYAQKIVSTNGQQDGLYWESKNGNPPCDVPKGFAEAAAAIKANTEPYHGYYFKILKAQGPDARGGALSYLVKQTMLGGFGLIAWPAQYGITGVQTFIVNHDGIVYEKHLGPDTARIAQDLTDFNPDKTWRPLQPE